MYTMSLSGASSAASAASNRVNVDGSPPSPENARIVTDVSFAKVILRWDVPTLLAETVRAVNVTVTPGDRTFEVNSQNSGSTLELDVTSAIVYNGGTYTIRVTNENVFGSSFPTEVTLDTHDRTIVVEPGDACVLNTGAAPVLYHSIWIRKGAKCTCSGTCRLNVTGALVVDGEWLLPM